MGRVDTGVDYSCYDCCKLGLALGFISLTVIKIISGKVRDVKLAMWVIAVLSVLFLLLNQL
jgi:AGZA family xanthine/uracil permease-like MFS transporter